MDVLIVGNGFDRKLGLKTDYISFLQWMKSKGYGVGNQFKNNSDKIDTPYRKSPTETRLAHLKTLNHRDHDFSGVKFNIRNKNGENHFHEQEERFYANAILYLLPQITNSNQRECISNKANIWYCFLQLLLFEENNKVFNLDTRHFTSYLDCNGNWVDVEGLIQKSIEVRINEAYYNSGIFSIKSYFDVFSLANLLSIDINDTFQKPKEEIYNIVWNDFLEFKEALCIYLEEISSKAPNIWPILKQKADEMLNNGIKTEYFNPEKYQKIISFNYTDFFSKSTVPISSYNVHGVFLDKRNIVFGLDIDIKNGLFKEPGIKTDFENKLHKNILLRNFLKISQLLQLQVEKEHNSFNTIGWLSIIGHSIGEQDYSYYFSILDRNVETIKITCYWYEFNEGGNNKDSLKNAVFEMLTAYERYSNKRVLHKMIFEARIKFKEIYIPRIIE